MSRWQRRSSRAEEDLLEIWMHIAADNLRAAERFFDRIEEVSEMLGRNPMAGRRREDLPGNLRSFAVGAYLVLYQPDEEGVLIVRVLHGGRDIGELV